MTRTARVVFASFFLSGATSLVYQVVWARALSLVFGHSTYAITAVLVAFMAGLALGSAVFARRAARIANPLRVYGALEIGIGLYCACVPFLLAAGTQTYFGIQRTLGLWPRWPRPMACSSASRATAPRSSWRLSPPPGWTAPMRRW
jgi:hypothetical protein